MAKKPSNQSVTVRKVRNRMILYYTVMILVIFATMFTYSFYSLREVAGRELSDNISEMTMQFMTSFDNFTDEVEADCTRVFRQEDIMSYDPIENSYPEYDSTQLRNQTKSALLNITAGENYADFMIIYSDSTTVGKVSSGTKEIVGNLEFDYFLNSLGDHNDAWLFGLDGNYRRIYYVREISDHAVFLISFFTEELDRVFAVHNPNYSQRLYIVDENDKVIYTNTENVTAESFLPSEYTGIFNGSDGDCVITDDCIGVSLKTDCGLRVIDITDSPTLLTLSPVTVTFGFFTAVALILISVATGIFCCRKYVHSGISDTNSEFVDPITGILNEYGLDEKITERLETSIVGSTYAFILLGVKDAEQIRDNVSPRYWNDIKTKLIKASEEFFGKKNIHMGKIGEDRIAVFADYSEFDMFKATENLRRGCEDFCKSFDNFTVGSENDMVLRVSIGVCIYPNHAEDFDTLLELAEQALAQADKSDKNSVVICNPSDKEKKETIGK